MKLSSLKITLLLITLLSIPILIPLWNENFILTDDGSWMAIRFSAFYQAAADGQFPVRFLHRLNHGYGYPVPTFLYPGFMYFGIPFKLIGFTVLDTMRIIISFSITFSGFFTYLWLKERFKNLPSILGAVVYMYVPYHIYDLYTRGSVGELFALVWIPFALFVSEKKSPFWTSIAVALLIISHNTVALLSIPLIGVYLLLSNSLKWTIQTFLLAFALSSFFIIPALYELQFTRFSEIQISDPLQYFADFRLMGFFLIGLLIASLIWIDKRKKHSKKYLLFMLTLILSLFLASPLSEIIWAILPASVVQFPFRFLSISLIASSFLFASITERTQGVAKLLILAFLVLLAIDSLPQISSARQTEMGVVFTEDIATTNQATTTVKNEYMPIWANNIPTEMASEKVNVENGEPENISYNNKSISFTANLENPAQANVNTIYWPGWQAKINGNNAEIEYEKNGLINLQLAEGQNNVEISFEETPIRKFANTVSLLTFLTLSFISIRSRIKK